MFGPEKRGSIGGLANIASSAFGGFGLVSGLKGVAGADVCNQKRPIRITARWRDLKEEVGFFCLMAYFPFFPLLCIVFVVSIFCCSL